MGVTGGDAGVKMNSACSVDFRMLSRLEKQLSAHPALTELMKCEFQRLTAGARAGALVERACCTVVSAAYLRFGFSVLGPAGRFLLARGLEELSGVPARVLMDWLESVSFSILEDMNVLHVVEGAPDWSEVDHSFARSLWKAFLCSSADESQLLGLSLFASADVGFMREAAQQNIALLLRDRDHFSVNFVSTNEFDPVFATAFRECMSEAASDHLVLLLWRIESYASFGGRSEPSGVCGSSSLPFKQGALSSGLFLMRDPSWGGASPQLEQLTGMAAVLALLSDLRLENGSPVFLESPASLKSLGQIVRGKLRCFAHPDSLGLLQGWLGELDSLPQQIERGLASGLLYEVRPAQGPPAYGLSSFGLRVLEPFRDLLSDLFIDPDLRPQTGEWAPAGLRRAKRNKGFRPETGHSDLAMDARAQCSPDSDKNPVEGAGTVGAGEGGFADFYRAVQSGQTCDDATRGPKAVPVHMRSGGDDQPAVVQPRKREKAVRKRPETDVRTESHSTNRTQKQRGSSLRSAPRLSRA